MRRMRRTSCTAAATAAACARRQQVVSLLQALELLRGAVLQLLIARELVRVQNLHRLAIGDFDVVGRGVVFQAEYMQGFSSVHGQSLT